MTPMQLKKQFTQDWDCEIVQARLNFNYFCKNCIKIVCRFEVIEKIASTKLLGGKKLAV